MDGPYVVFVLSDQIPAAGEEYMPVLSFWPESSGIVGHETHEVVRVRSVTTLLSEYGLAALRTGYTYTGPPAKTDPMFRLTRLPPPSQPSTYLLVTKILSPVLDVSSETTWSSFSSRRSNFTPYRASISSLLSRIGLKYLSNADWAQR